MSNQGLTEPLTTPTMVRRFSRFIRPFLILVICLLLLVAFANAYYSTVDRPDMYMTSFVGETPFLVFHPKVLYREPKMYEIYFYPRLAAPQVGSTSTNVVLSRPVLTTTTTITLTSSRDTILPKQTLVFTFTPALAQAEVFSITNDFSPSSHATLFFTTDQGLTGQVNIEKEAEWAMVLRRLLVLDPPINVVVIGVTSMFLWAITVWSRSEERNDRKQEVSEAFNTTLESLHGATTRNNKDDIEVQLRKLIELDAQSEYLEPPKKQAIKLLTGLHHLREPLKPAQIREWYDSLNGEQLAQQAFLAILLMSPQLIRDSDTFSVLSKLCKSIENSELDELLERERRLRMSNPFERRREFYANSTFDLDFERLRNAPIVSIHGPPGSGKTTLLLALMQPDLLLQGPGDTGRVLAIYIDLAGIKNLIGVQIKVERIFVEELVQIILRDRLIWDILDDDEQRLARRLIQRSIAIVDYHEITINTLRPTIDNPSSYDPEILRLSHRDGAGLASFETVLRGIGVVLERLRCDRVVVCLDNVSLELPVSFLLGRLSAELQQQIFARISYASRRFTPGMEDDADLKVGHRVEIRLQGESISLDEDWWSKPFGHSEQDRLETLLADLEAFGEIETTEFITKTPLPLLTPEVRTSLRSKASLPFEIALWYNGFHKLLKEHPFLNQDQAWELFTTAMHEAREANRPARQGWTATDRRLALSNINSKLAASAPIQASSAASLLESTSALPEHTAQPTNEPESNS